jgi:hypothetical protein
MNGGMTVRDFFLGQNGKSEKNAKSPSGQNSTSATSATSATSSFLTSIPSLAPITSLGSTLYGVNANTSSKMGIYVKQILSYLFGIAIVILIIMLFIHFFITPVFSAQPGAPGIFVIPGLDDGVLFWNKSNAAIIPNKNLPIQNMDYKVDKNKTNYLHTLDYKLYDCNYNSYKVVIKNVSKMRQDKINQILDGN